MPDSVTLHDRIRPRAGRDMNLIELHDRLLGEWSGTSTLWLSWLEEPEQRSPSRLRVAAVANGEFLSFQYSWVYEGEQEGLLLLGNDNEDGAANAAWVDSWHMSGKIMHCTGEVDGAGATSLRGSYQAPPGPDWGWRIDVSLPEPGALRIEMHNVDPDGSEELAVRAEYRR